MTNLDIAQQRLHNQRIADSPFEKPADVVQWLGAVQAQDYAAAKWAVGLRSRGVTDDDIEQAFTDGALLRTHVMRPTWHFVSPADIRWMLTLTAPRVNALNAYYYHKLGLDDAVFMHSNAVLAKALQGGKQLTRAELISVLKQSGIATDTLGFLYLLGRAELDGIVCSGARRGKQFTYALLEERAPQARVLDRDEALAELARRYFTSHGPGTLQDFGWWSGLTAADARAGLEMVKSQFINEAIGGQTYWLSPSMPTTKVASPTAHLLPAYDEYTVAYKDRSAILDPVHAEQARNGILSPTIAVNGQIVGTWKRTLTKDAVILTPNLLTPLNKAETRALAASVNRYGAFLGRSVNATLQVE
jgi:hypothetical protein